MPRAALSAELFSIPIEEDRFIIYAPLRRAAFVADGKFVNLLSRLQENGLLDESLDLDGSAIEFLRRLEIVDGGPEVQPISVFEGLPEPTELTLFLTTACNLRCTYCYAAAGDTKAKFMSLDVATRGIDFVAANAKRRNRSAFEVTFHGGGEPTVHWKVMTNALDYARRRARVVGLQVKAFSATNGVLNDEQLDWIIANLDGLSISFDGLPEEHDKNRLTVLGDGSSARVRHPPRSGWLDELGRLKGGRSVVLGVARCAP